LTSASLIPLPSEPLERAVLSGMEGQLSFAFPDLPSK
jgi:hypothetical protein